MKQEDILQKYKTRFGKSGRDLEFLDGWNLMVEDFLAKLDALDPKRKFKLFCIKEKFGGMRIQFEAAIPNEIHMLAGEYEVRSMTTCDVCGHPGERMAPRGWYKVRCKAHRGEAPWESPIKEE